LLTRHYARKTSYQCNIHFMQTHRSLTRSQILKTRINRWCLYCSKRTEIFHRNQRFCLKGYRINLRLMWMNSLALDLTSYCVSEQDALTRNLSRFPFCLAYTVLKLLDRNKTWNIFILKKVVFMQIVYYQLLLFKTINFAFKLFTQHLC